MKKDQKLKAFTLSESLLTLTIIGIIGALTIPLVKGNIEEKILITKLKSVNESLTNAFELAVTEQGTVNNWEIDSYSSIDKETGRHNIDNDNFWGKLAPYIKSVRYETADKFETSTKSRYEWEFKSFKDKSVTSQFNSQLFLSNGVCYTGFWAQAPNCKPTSNIDFFGTDYCGNFAVDLNCEKGPNVAGRDVFHFYVTKDKIAPMGDPEGSNYNFENYCIGNPSNPKHSGFGCSAWPIYNENMDYLRCPESLSWDGNTECP